MSLSVTDLTPVAGDSVHTRYRRIVTPIPVPASIAEIQRLRCVEPRSMSGMPPILWDNAEGFLVRDRFGNQWIDLSSGIVVANVGHSHPEILAAIRSQLDARRTFSYAFATTVRRELLERLVEAAPPGLNKAILLSAGTEATECAISLMRKHGAGIAPAKIGVLSMESSYHGRTLAAKLAGGSPGHVDGLQRENVFHWQLPLPGGSDSQGFDEDLAARGVEPDRIAGILIESIPGWTTALHPPDYIARVMRWAAAHQVLVAVDEIQCGFGRTGRMFAFEHYGITPDLILCGKGLSSSLPISAVITRAEIADLAPPGEMSSTFGGNPVCAAAALAALTVLQEEKLACRAARLGEDLAPALESLAARHQAHIKNHNGRGLFHSIHFHDPRTGAPLTEAADQIVMSCVRRGVLMFSTGRGFIKIVPPLTIDRDALFEAIDVIGESMEEVLCGAV